MNVLLRWNVRLLQVAIKYNKVFVDGYWNSREQSFGYHIFNFLTVRLSICGQAAAVLHYMGCVHSHPMSFYLSICGQAAAVLAVLGTSPTPAAVLAVVVCGPAVPV